MRAVLFDLDGTLMDHDSAREAGLAAHLGEWLGAPAPEELTRLDEEWRRLEARHYEEYASGMCSFQEQRRRRVRGMHTALGREQPDGEAAEAWFVTYLKHYRAAWRAFADVLPALEELRAAYPQAKLGVVTNGEGEPQRAKLAAIGLGERFEVVVASGEVGVAKPRREIFALACERLGVEPGQAAHVGDRLDLDAQGAAAAGLRGIWLDRLGAAVAGAAAEVEGVARISSLRELPLAIGG